MAGETLSSVTLHDDAALGVLAFSIPSLGALHVSVALCLMTASVSNLINIQPFSQDQIDQVSHSLLTNVKSVMNRLL
ncbi:hypothetical protein J6590_071741 [Homalodisca vitripennis]|nr:hypothetical protein J6590_071741 [Homalodisca vitripennis]